MLIKEVCTVCFICEPSDKGNRTRLTLKGIVMADVFISHVEANEDIAQALAEIAELAGYSVWFYERNSIPGLSYLTQVNEAIESCKLFVLVVSTDAIKDSGQVTKEVVRAHEAEKPFMPVLVNISHAEFQRQKPEWRMAAGASTSIRLDVLGMEGVGKAIVSALKHFEISIIQGFEQVSSSASSQISASVKNRVHEQISKASKAVLRVVSVEDLHNMGWSTERIIDATIHMDYDNLSDVSENDVGQTITWKPIVENNQDAIFFVLNEADAMIAYWHFLPLDSETYEKAKSGRLDDGTIRITDLNIIGPPGEYNMYFMMICVHPHYRSVKVLRILSDAFVDNLIYLGNNDIYFPEMCATAFTPEGEQLCKTLKMQHITMHASRGKVFYLNMRDLPPSIFYKQELIDLYKNKYKNQ